MPDPTCNPDAATLITKEVVALVLVPLGLAVVAWFRKTVLNEQAPAQVARSADEAVQAAEERYAGTGPAGAVKHRTAKERVLRVAKARGIRLTDADADEAVLAAVHRAPGLGKSGNAVGVGAAGKGVPEGPREG